jgi:hypothetical protein
VVVVASAWLVTADRFSGVALVLFDIMSSTIRMIVRTMPITRLISPSVVSYICCYRCYFTPESTNSHPETVKFLTPVPYLHDLVRDQFEES